MSGFAVLAAALTDHGARYATLTIAGNDLLIQPGTQGQRTGIPIDSILHVEKGPGGVSELRFSIEDPTGTVTLNRNDLVRFEKTAEAIPVFQGFVTSWVPEPMGPSGRRLMVRCSGLEIVLDWAKVAAITVPANLEAHTAVQLLVASVVNGLAYPLNTASGGVFGSYTTPIASYLAFTTSAVPIAAGTTLREAIGAVNDQIGGPGGPFSSDAANSWTVDSMGGLRFWQSLLSLVATKAGDMAELFVVDAQTSPADGSGTVGSPMVAADIEYESDATAPASVLVIGSGVSALVHDVTDDPGDTAVLNDSSLTTLAQCQSAGLAYLAQYFNQRRASFNLNNKTPQPTFRAGSTVTFTDAGIGIASEVALVMQLERRFYGTRENWAVTIGGMRASMVAETRRQTRSILN